MKISIQNCNKFITLFSRYETYITLRPATLKHEEINFQRAFVQNARAIWDGEYFMSNLFWF